MWLFVRRQMDLAFTEYAIIKWMHGYTDLFDTHVYQLAASLYSS